MLYVNILKGYHRGTEITGIYPVIKDFTETPTGGHITVQVEVAPPFSVPNPRIKLNRNDFVYCDGEGETDDEADNNDGELFQVRPLTTAMYGNVSFEEKVLSLETEDDAIERIRHAFDMFDRATVAAINGTIRGLVVSGPPGIGKSHGIEEKLTHHERETLRQLGNDDDESLYTVISGSTSAVGLFTTLYDYRHKGNTVVFDDCDEIFGSEESLNLLKAVLDSGVKRHVSWNKKSRVLEQEDIPNSFEFEGTVIVLTNIDFDRVKGRLKQHLDAIMSRCHYINLEVNTNRDKMLRVKQIVRDGMLDRYRFKNNEEQAIIEFMETNADFLHDISLRMVTKIADLVAIDSKWQDMAETTCMKREARFMRLYKQRTAEGETCQE